MLVGAADEHVHLLLERLHGALVHVVRAGYQVALVRIFGRQAVRDEVAALEEMVDALLGIVRLHPPAGVDMRDVAALARRLGLGPGQREGKRAAPERIERPVFLGAIGHCEVFGGECGEVAVQVHPRLVCECRRLGDGCRFVRDGVEARRILDGARADALRPLVVRRSNVAFRLDRLLRGFGRWCASRQQPQRQRKGQCERGEQRGVAVGAQHVDTSGLRRSVLSERTRCILSCASGVFPPARPRGRIGAAAGPASPQ